MSVPLSTCLTPCRQPHFMLAAVCSLHLLIMMKKGGRELWGRWHWMEYGKRYLRDMVRGWGGWWASRELKTNKTSPATEKRVHFAFWSVSGNLFQRVGAVLWNDLAPRCFLFVFSPNPENRVEAPLLRPLQKLSLKRGMVLDQVFIVVGIIIV